MAKRLTAGLLVTAGALAAAPAAQAALVYVKRAGTPTPQVWVARDDGSHQRRVGPGTLPAISPDGRWIAWQDGRAGAVMLRKTAGRNTRRIARSRVLGELGFSPDSKRLGIVLRRKLVVYDLASRDSATVANGFVDGFSFAPDSKSLVYGTTGSSEAFDAGTDLYTVGLDSDAGKSRVTRDRKSLNPLWGPGGDILFDRQTIRDADAPTYNLYAIHPDGGALRRVTALKIPPLLSGLVPLELSADGNRLLAEFVGQDTAVGFAVNPVTGRTRALSKKNMETGFVASNLTADGRTVLGMTGGGDPANDHDVVTLPYAGGKATVLVQNAAYPDWTR